VVGDPEQVEIAVLHRGAPPVALLGLVERDGGDSVGIDFEQDNVVSHWMPPEDIVK
jgi:hypothetical protein